VFLTKYLRAKRTHS